MSSLLIISSIISILKSNTEKMGSPLYSSSCLINHSDLVVYIDLLSQEISYLLLITTSIGPCI